MTMDKSWKDMLLGPSEKDHERWAKESAVRIAKQMDEALKKADTASPMTTQIKQVDREDLKSAFRTSDVPAKNIALRKAYDAIGAYEARIAELERERDAAEVPWVCFHCGEVCKTREQAEEHFGDLGEEAPICISAKTLWDERELREIILQSRELWSDLRKATAENEKLEHCLNSFEYGARKITGKPSASINDLFMAYDFMEGRATTAEARLAEAVDVIEAVHSEGMMNHNTRCKSWWSSVARFIREKEHG